MTIFHEKLFSGEVPIVDSGLLKPGFLSLASDCDLSSGAIDPFKGQYQVYDSSRSNVKTIYRYEGLWLDWDKYTNVVRGPVLDDVYKRIFWTNGSGLKWARQYDVTHGGPPYPASYMDAGIPSPTVAPDPIISGTATSTPNNDVRSYVYTWVDAYGNESGPSPVGMAHESGYDPPAYFNPGQSMTVHCTTRAGCTVRLYRTIPGNVALTYYYVKDSDVQTISDDVAATGEACPSINWLEPPADLKGIIGVSGGFLVGISGTDMRMSVPYYPHAWPSSYSRVVPDIPVAVGEVNGGWAVVTKGNPWLFTGNDPLSVTGRKFQNGAACASARGCVSMAGSLFYPGNEGLMRVDFSGCRNVTQNLISSSQWRDLGPSAFIAQEWRGGWLGWNGKNGILIRPGYNEVIRLTSDFSVSGAFTDTSNGKGYIAASNGIIREIDGDSVKRAFTVKTRMFTAGAPWCPGVLQVIAASYSSLRASIYMDGALWYECDVTSRLPIPLPSGKRGIDFEVELRGTDRVQEVFLASNANELRRA